MSKLLVVFGATGNQGSSVIKHVLASPHLSKEYRIRAITRDSSSHQAKKLATLRVDVVSGDVNNPSSLLQILSGAHTVFGMTTTNYAGPEGHDEVQQGKNIVDAAIQTEAQYLVWSTLPSPSAISKGKYQKVISFDAKAAVETYIRSKSIRSAFFAPGSFMQNFATVMKPIPSPSNDGSYLIARPVAPSTKLPLLDIGGDTGMFVAALLMDPAKFEGRTICGASALYSMDEQATIIGEATGKVVRYQQVPQDIYRSYLPPNVADELTEMLLYQEEFGYYGAETERLVEESVDDAIGQPISFQQFLQQNPMSFD
jgi:uncharacterized protein YbjT (DUF2867 family)